MKQYRLLYVQVTADQQLSKKNTLEFLYIFPIGLLCTSILKTKPNKALNENEEIIIPTLNLEVVYISINHLDVSLTIVNLAHWLAKKKTQCSDQCKGYQSSFIAWKLGGGEGGVRG